MTDKNKGLNETGYTFPTGEKANEAGDWMKKNWDWMSDEDHADAGDKENLKEKLKKHYGEDRWEEEYRKFTTEYPDFE